MKKQTHYLEIQGMTCASCVNRIEKALLAIPHVQEAYVNFAESTVYVAGMDITRDEIATLITDLGYHVLSNDGHFHSQKSHENYVRGLSSKTTIAFLLGVLLFVWTLFFPHTLPLTTQYGQITLGLVGCIVLIAQIYSGGYIYKSMWKALLRGTANMNTLISIGTAAAWLYSMTIIIFARYLPPLELHVYFEAGLLVLGFVNLGNLLELRARQNTSSAIMHLLEFSPRTARICRDKKEMDIPIAEVQINDILRVRPGEKIPVDGIVIEGTSFVNESMLTGESSPVRKQLGEWVRAGTLNENGTFLFKAQRIGADTTLARLIALVRRAQATKPRISRLVDRVAGIFVPIVLLIAIVTGVIWGMYGPTSDPMYVLITVMSVLIIACPCALGLGTPISITIGVGKAAEHGILIRNGQALETAGKITTVLLDKTGTVTQGHPEVTNLYGLVAWDDRRLLQYAASLETLSEHPIAAALVTEAKAQAIDILSVAEFQAYPGKGVSGVVNQEIVRLGHHTWLEEQAINTSALLERAEKFAKHGETVLFLAVNDVAVGIIAVADRIKPDAQLAVQRLKQMHMNVILVSGDHAGATLMVGKYIGVDDVRPECSPQDKLAFIETLQQRGEIVAMVGDGINDAAALAKANIGFAIGSGTDIAIESADVTLLGQSLHNIANTILLSRATLRNIKQNLLGASIYNLLSIPIAAGILYPFTGLLLNPAIAGAAMALSSITVVMNANRLRNVTLQKEKIERRE